MQRAVHVVKGLNGRRTARRRGTTRTHVRILLRFLVPFEHVSDPFQPAFRGAARRTDRATRTPCWLSCDTAVDIHGVDLLVGMILTSVGLLSFAAADWMVMSLQPRSLPEVSADTARAARAAFPRGSMAIRVRDELGEVWSDERFRGLFGVRGKPGIFADLRLAARARGVTLLSPLLADTSPAGTSRWLHHRGVHHRLGHPPRPLPAGRHQHRLEPLHPTRHRGDRGPVRRRHLPEVPLDRTRTTHLQRIFPSAARQSSQQGL